MKLVYPAIFTPFSDEDYGGGYLVEVPDLRGCVTEGDTLQEAIDMGVDAASGWILTALESGEEYPAPSSITDIVPPEGSFVSLLSLDMDSYAEKYGRKSVRKNITLPAWLNTYGENHHINFSKVLADAVLLLAAKQG